MNSLYILAGVLLAASQVSHSFPYAAFYGDYPAFGHYGIAHPYPYAAYAYGAFDAIPYGYPYLHHYYHPGPAVRNVASSFHAVDEHISDTSLLSPFAKSKKN